MPQVTTLLAFRIAGVPLAVPAESVQSILMPPAQLTHPPGSRGSTPGIFHYAGQVHSVIDLHPRLGIVEPLGEDGRLLLHEQQGRRYAFRVDTIIGLINPEQGQWAKLPPYLPRKVFWSGFLYRDEILLCTKLDTLREMHDASPLRQHLQQQQAKLDGIRPAETVPPEEPTPDTPNIAGKQTTAAEIRPAVNTSPPRASTDHTAQVPSPVTPGRDRAARDAVPPKPSPHPAPILAATVSTQPSRPRPSPASTAIAGKKPNTKPLATRRQASKTTTPAHPASTQPRPELSIGQAIVQNGDTPQQNHALLWAILWLLLLGSAAGGGWWLFSPASTPGKLVYTSPAPIPPIVRQPAEPEPAMPVPKPVSKPEPKPEPIPEAMPAPTAAATATDDAAPTSTSHGSAALRLERDDDGILNLIIERQPQADNTLESASDAQALIALTPVREALPESSSTDTPMDDDAAAPQAAPTPLRPEPPGPVPAAELDLDEALWLDLSRIPLEPCRCEHIVVRGDTLWSIAMRYTGNAFNYPLLARQSGIDNPDLIYPGDRIRIIVR